MPKEEKSVVGKFLMGWCSKTFGMHGLLSLQAKMPCIGREQQAVRVTNFFIKSEV